MAEESRQEFNRAVPKFSMAELDSLGANKPQQNLVEDREAQIKDSLFQAKKSGYEVAIETVYIQLRKKFGPMHEAVQTVERLR